MGRRVIQKNGTRTKYHLNILLCAGSAATGSPEWQFVREKTAHSTRGMQGWFSKPEAMLCSSCRNRRGDQRSHICNKFTGRQGQGGSQKRLQTQRKFVDGEVDFYVTLVAGIVVAGARIRNGCVSRSGGVQGSAIDDKARKFRRARGDGLPLTVSP